MTTFLAVGDVGPDGTEPDVLFANVAETIRSADLAFCQLEIALTERGQRVPQVRHTSRNHPDIAQGIKRAGFHLVSWASNHALDWGFEGFHDTIDALEAAGLTPLGVGSDLAEARAVKVTEVDGIRVAVLAYCSILPMDYWATSRRPGVAPMRALTAYEPTEHDQPGTPSTAWTFPHPVDLQGMLDDIAAAKRVADVVMVSHHWGIHFTHAELAHYQRVVAHAAVDAGADLVLGHHAHILKPVEVYRGKAIFYSLGNFAIELPMDEEHASRPTLRTLLDLHPGWEPDITSNYNFPFDSRKTIVVRAELTKDGVRDVAILPAWVDSTAVPSLLDPLDPRFTEVVEYLARISREQGLDTTFTPDGDRVRVDGA